MEQAVDNPERRPDAAPDEGHSAADAGVEVAAASGAGGADEAAAVTAEATAEPAGADDAPPVAAASGEAEAAAPAERSADAGEGGGASGERTGDAADAGGESLAAASAAAAEPEAAALPAVSAAEPAPQPVGDTVAAGKRHKRVLTGTVVSNGGEQSIVVSIARRKKHRLYKKYRTLSKKVMAHDPDNDCRPGDLVRVVESRPRSKMKRWLLAEIVKRGG